MSNAYFPSLAGIQWDVIKRPKFATKIAQYVSGKEIRVSNYANPVWEWEMIYGFLRADSHAELQTLMGFFLARQGNYDSFLFADPSESNAVVAQPLGTGDSTNTLFVLTKTYGGFTEPVGYCLPASLHLFFTVGVTTTEQLQTQTQVFNIVVSGTPTINSVIYTNTATYVFGFPTNMTGSSFSNGTNPSSTVIFSLQKNSVAFGTVSVNTSGVATFVATATNFAIGDVFTIVAPANLYGIANLTFNLSNNYTAWTLNSSNQIVFTYPPATGTLVTGTYTWYYRVRFGEDAQDYSNFMYQLWELKKLTLHSVKP